LNPMSTVPTDRNVILHMPDHSTFCAGLEQFEGEEEDTYGWVCHDFGASPDDWHDDVCWGVNYNGKQSTQPIGWSEYKST